MVVAILTFENRTRNPSLDFWHLAPEWLIAESLGKLPTIRVESGEGFALHELHHESYNAIDAAQARKMGEILEVRRVIWGAYEQRGQRWVVTAQILNVSDGRIIKEIKASSKDWFEIRDELVTKILAQFHLGASREENQRMRKRWSQSAEALEWILRAKAMETHKPFAEIEAALHRAIAADSQCAQAHAQLAAALFNEGRTEDAEKETRVTITTDPNYEAGHLLLGILLAQRQQYEDAEKSLKHAEALAPTSAQIEERLGELYDVEGMAAKAAVSYARAAELDRFSSSVHAHLGYTYVTQGRIREGMQELKQAERLAYQPDAGTEQFLGYAYEQLHDVPASISHYESLISICRNQGINPERTQWFEQRVLDLKARLTPAYLDIIKPTQYSREGLTARLQQKLDSAEMLLVTNPVASTAEMQGWAHKITGAATNDLQKAQLLFEAVAHHVSPQLGGTRTAREVFAVWNSADASFRCSEYAAFYVALSRACGLDACCVLVDVDYAGRVVLHECACVFLGAKALLVDPAYFWFGVPHRKFRPLSDPEAIAVWLGGQPGTKQQEIAWKLAPNLPFVRFSRVMRFIAADDLASARQALREALKLDPDNQLAMLAQANLALHEGNSASAIVWAQKAVEASPDSSYGYAFLGQAYRVEGNFSKALQAFHNALRGNDLEEAGANSIRTTIAQINEVTCGEPNISNGKPKTAAGFLARGELWFEKGEIDKAINDYSEAVRLAPGDVSVYENRAYCYLRRGEFDKAIADCNEAIRLDPNLALVWSYLATAYSQKDEISQDIDKLKHEVKTDPKNLDAYARLATLLAKLPQHAIENRRKAVDAARKACELSGWQNWQYVAALANAYVDIGDYESVAKYTERIGQMGDVADEAKAQLQEWLSNYYTWHDSLMATNFSTNSQPIDASKPLTTVDLVALKQSAESGDAKAQATLAGFLNEGSHGCPTNRVEAYKWAALAESGGNKDGHYLVQEIELFMAPVDLSQAKASVQDFLDRRKR